jgi:hypothetical protein
MVEVAATPLDDAGQFDVLCRVAVELAIALGELQHAREHVVDLAHGRRREGLG